MKKDDPSMAETLGKGYAHVQHGIDKVIAWGFEKMKDVDAAKAPQKFENPHMEKAAKAGRSVLGFLGRAGESYFKTYEDLKKNKKD
jgi:hypothetical protein